MGEMILSLFQSEVPKNGRCLDLVSVEGKVMPSLELLVRLAPSPR